MLHLSAYLIRRIVFSFCLVFFHNYAAIGIWLLMMSAVFMIAILWRDNQWWEHSIKKQHMINEITLYIMCIMLLMFVDIWDNFDCTSYTIIGWFFLALLLMNIIYNSYVIIRYTGAWLNLYRIRRKNIIENRRSHKKLERINDHTHKKYEKLKHKLSKEDQQSWDEQWRKMCDNRDGWLK